MRKSADNTVSTTFNTPEEAIEYFFRKYYTELCRGVSRLLKDPALSEDLVQEVFIRIWDKKDHLKFDNRFIYYLKKSCYHAALANLPGNLPSVDATDTPERDKADSQLMANELETSVRLAINKLPEKTKLIFSLSRYEEMTYRQISEQLDLSVKAIEKHMGQALRLLRESLKDHLIHLLLILFFKP